MTDAYVSEVTVVLDARYQDEPMATQALDMLRGVGMAIRSVDADRSVIEGDVDARKLHDLEHLDCVDYVRTVFTYAADYPPGDPRDLDGRAAAGG